MRRSRAGRSALLALAISSALLAAGCGGDENEAPRGGDSSEVSGVARGGGEEVLRGASLSKPEFIKEAAKACKEARKGLHGQASRFLASQDPSKPRPVMYADLAHLVLLPGIERELEAIRVLGVPPSEEKRIDEILSEGEFTINTVVYEPRIASIHAIYRQFADVHGMFSAYGLPDCVPLTG
jgi:hypothetical protein